MTLDEYTRLDAIALAAAIRAGECTVAEVVDAAHRACAAVNPALNAVLEMYADPAMPVAPNDGLLAGVPMLRKDSGATEAGRLQEHGSRLMVGCRPLQDSHYVALCRRAGLVFVGRSALPEFAFSSATESRLCGITRNPWDVARMAGGSSGGAAAAVAAGIVPIAHGSDGGGSIRIPAAACGVVGLKPSRGRVSQGPDGADALLGLSEEFVLCRSIRDAAAVLEVLGVPQAGDPFVIPVAGGRAALPAGAAPQKLRIAVCVDRWGDAAVDPQIAAAVLRVARSCEQAGHVVEDASPRFDFEVMLRVLTDCFAFGLANLRAAAMALGRTPGEDSLEPITYANWQHAERMTAADVDATLTAANGLRRTVGAFFGHYDVLLTPALANLPPEHGRYSQSRRDLDPLGFMRELQYTDQFLPIFNVTGQPALSIPCARSTSGLPIGAQLVGRAAREDVILALGEQILEAMPALGRPAVWAGNA